MKKASRHRHERAMDITCRECGQTNHIVLDERTGAWSTHFCKVGFAREMADGYDADQET